MSGCEGLYEVSDLGRVRCLPRPLGQRGPKAARVLSPVLRASAPGKTKKYAYVNIGGRTMPVHRLVLLAFVGPPPEGMTDGCHADDDSMNNRLDNLRWDSRAGNMADASRNGLTASHWTHCRRGHEFTPENTWVSKTGMRMCRACARLRTNPDGNVAPRDRTHCPQGHPYDEANTAIYGGGRYCRTCARESARAYRAAKKAAAT